MLQAGIDFTFPPKETGAIRARLQYILGFAVMAPACGKMGKPFPIEAWLQQIPPVAIMISDL